MNLAIVTGGSQGLGRALCERYVAEGWRVVEFSRSAPHPYSIRVDLARPSEAAEVFRSAFSSIDGSALERLVVVNNAAMLGPIGPVTRAEFGSVEEHVAVNVTSAVALWREVVLAFQELACAKTFANISSGAATKGYAGWSLYCASKAALENFVRAAALEQEGQPHPVRAISVNPGIIDTAMQASIRAASANDFPTVERFVRFHAEGQLATPESVAEQIAAIIESAPEPGGVYQVTRA